MDTRRYIELLNHTGDVGIRVRAAELPELFELAAEAMFQIICPKCAVRNTLTRHVAVAGDDLGQLLVNWLSELNFWFCTEQELYGEFRVSSLGDGFLRGVACGEKVDPQRHAIRTEIKAVTYHKLYVTQRDQEWEAQVIFDI
ncbi:MAG: archease [bacterium]|jgi:SHS2 domain-containing protein|nr:archease [candidate division KSB1 bacterium]MDH7561145.1 archease [bacterium]